MVYPNSKHHIPNLTKTQLYKIEKITLVIEDNQTNLLVGIDVCIEGVVIACGKVT